MPRKAKIKKHSKTPVGKKHPKEPVGKKSHRHGRAHHPKEEG